MASEMERSKCAKVAALHVQSDNLARGSRARLSQDTNKAGAVTLRPSRQFGD